MRKKTTTIILVILLLTGLSLLLYPSVADYYYSLKQTRAISHYATEIAELDTKDYTEILEAARSYNLRLFQTHERLSRLNEEEREIYNRTLNVSGDGMMGYIEIQKISCLLPVYHGTEDAVLDTAIGHIEGSSLPVGGESTHCVLSGHRGLPSAKLFSNLDQLSEGDTFILRTLDEVLTYEVDQIRIVLPDEIDELGIVEGQDYCTLVTCTPYGINTHRLLVRGHRIDNIESGSTLRITADAMQIEPVMVAPFMAIPIFLVMLGWISAASRARKRRRAEESAEKRQDKKQSKKEKAK